MQIVAEVTNGLSQIKFRVESSKDRDNGAVDLDVDPQFKAWQGTNDHTKKARLSLTSVVTNERLRVVG